MSAYADQCLIDAAYSLALFRLTPPTTPADCALCRELSRPCVVHKAGSDWPQPKEQEGVK
jgi:hypothetical protein